MHADLALGELYVDAGKRNSGTSGFMVRQNSVISIQIYINDVLIRTDFEHRLQIHYSTLGELLKRELDSCLSCSRKSVELQRETGHRGHTPRLQEERGAGHCSSEENR